MQQREDYKRQIKSGLREETLGKTFDHYAIEWMQAYKSNVSIKTYNDYARYINLASRHIGDHCRGKTTGSDARKP